MVLNMDGLLVQIGARVLNKKECQPMLVQFGKPDCVRCTPFSSVVRALLQPSTSSEHFAFEWIYVDIGNDENAEAQESFGLTRLPAFALYSGGESEDHNPIVVNSATRDDLIKALDEHSKARVHQLVLDADF